MRVLTNPLSGLDLEVYATLRRSPATPAQLLPQMFATNTWEIVEALKRLMDGGLVEKAGGVYAVKQGA